MQNEFISNFSDQFAYEIKAGETLPSGGKITNEDAGLMLMAFDLKEPWATHRRYEVWEEKHALLFARPEVTADRIILVLTVSQVVNDKLIKIKNELVRKYVLTRYMLIYIVRLVLESEAPSLLARPGEFVRDAAHRAKLYNALGKITDDLAIDLNFEVEELGESFDYRGNLRDKDWVADTARAVVSSRTKDIGRGKAEPFEKILANL